MNTHVAVSDDQFAFKCFRSRSENERNSESLGNPFCSVIFHHLSTAFQGEQEVSLFSRPRGSSLHGILSIIYLYFPQNIRVRADVTGAVRWRELLNRDTVDFEELVVSVGGSRLLRAVSCGQAC